MIGASSVYFLLSLHLAHHILLFFIAMFFVVFFLLLQCQRDRQKGSKKQQKFFNALGFALSGFMTLWNVPGVCQPGGSIKTGLLAPARRVSLREHAHGGWECVPEGLVAVPTGMIVGFLFLLLGVQEGDGRFGVLLFFFLPSRRAAIVVAIPGQAGWDGAKSSCFLSQNIPMPHVTWSCRALGLLLGERRRGMGGWN